MKKKLLTILKGFLVPFGHSGINKFHDYEKKGIYVLLQFLKGSRKSNIGFFRDQLKIQVHLLWK